MKNYEAIKLYQFLAGSVGSQLKMKYKTRLTMKQNIKLLAEYYQNMAEMEAEKNTKSEILKEFQADLLEKGKDFFEKDKEGNIITHNDTANVLPGKLGDVQKIQADLSNMDKYKEAISLQTQKEEEWKELMESEIDFEITKVPIEGFEEPDLTSYEWSIFELILEEVE